MALNTYLYIIQRLFNKAVAAAEADIADLADKGDGVSAWNEKFNNSVVVIAEL
jgi:hypothetical protein